MSSLCAGAAFWSLENNLEMASPTNVPEHADRVAF